ncbi:hypothetical protein VTO42DRAFT_1971 [Malbranchea cinnamomea]
MGDQQQNITQILAALAAAQPGAQSGAFALPTSTPPAPVTTTPGYPLPPPDNTGKLDISGVRPVNTGTVSIAEAITKARGFAAEKGIPPFNPERGPPRGDDSLRDPRSHRRSRSPSRSPPRRRDVFRDNYNPYRDERRGENRGGNDRGYRERSFSPRPAGRRDPYSPPPNRQYNRSPPVRRGPGGDDSSETLSLDSRLVGLVIGRQGETLRKVEADTQARVQFLECPEPHTRLCRITGSKAAREDAKAEINRIIRENATGSRPTTGLCEWPPRDSSGMQSDEKFVQIMVPDRTVGLIIGRGGETIQDLQERSGCHVNIKDKSINGLRPVNLTGPARATERAKNLIMEIVESDTWQMANPSHRDSRPSESAAGPGEKVNDSFFVPKDAVGMIIGKGGETIKELQAITGCKVNILPPSGRNGEREVTLWGTRTAIEQARKDILEKVEAVKQRNQSQAQQREEAYNAPPSYSHYQTQPPPQAQAPSTSSQSHPQQPQPPQAPGQPHTGNGTDPYAPYGGYENYVRMWYAALAAQQQQQQQQQQSQQYQHPQSQGTRETPAQTDQPGPPGLS